MLLLMQFHYLFEQMGDKFMETAAPGEELMTSAG